MTARFTAGLYLTIALGFVLAWRRETWEEARIPLAMLWSFAGIALASAVFVLAKAPGVIHRERPFTWVWFFLYDVSVVWGFYYQIAYPQSFGGKPW